MRTNPAFTAPVAAARRLPLIRVCAMRRTLGRCRAYRWPIVADTSISSLAISTRCTGSIMSSTPATGHLPGRRSARPPGFPPGGQEPPLSGPFLSCHSSPRCGVEPVFYSKARWGRWINGQPHPPRKAIKILAGKLADDEIKAGHLLELWDAAFAPVTGDTADPGSGDGPGEPEVPPSPDSLLALD